MRMDWMEESRAAKAKRMGKKAGKPGLATMKLYMPWMAAAEAKRRRLRAGASLRQKAAMPTRLPQAP
ncbi:hypothetical protein FACS1894130_10590 [Spirochaetia bacterium]|nr:hypothetical protein FACS1894130_10590 [Spirochaetia bacterium]